MSGFINIKDMYNNDVGKSKYGFMKLMKQNKGWRLLECLFYFIKFLPTSLLCIFILLQMGKRVCCLLVLDSVTSTPQWIR